MSKVTVAPITSTIKGLSSELPLDERNGLDHPCAASLDNVVTIPTSLLGRVVGFLRPEQERGLAVATVLAYDLDISVPSQGAVSGVDGSPGGGQWRGPGQPARHR